MLQSDEVATAWLNDESVRKAIHAQPVNDFNFTCIVSKFSLLGYILRLTCAHQ